MKRFVRFVALALVTAASPACAAKLDAKLTAEVDRQGHVTATLKLTNNTRKPICFLADESQVMLQASDGSVLGNPAIIDFLRPDSVDIVWDGGYPQSFDVHVNAQREDGVYSALGADDLKRLAKAVMYFRTYDCIDFLADRGNAKPRIGRVITTVPEIEH